MDSQLLHDIAGFFSIFSGVLLTIGLIRPFIVVWWGEHKTRMKVLQVYGSILLISSVIFFVTIDPNRDPAKDNTTPKEQINE